MNRTRLQELFATHVPVRRGEAVVATSYVHPVRGRVACASAAVLGGGLRRRGLAVRYEALGRVGEGVGELRGVTYIDRAGDAWGLAVVTSPDDSAAGRAAAQEVSDWAEALRTRRLALSEARSCCLARPEAGGEAAAGDACAAAAAARAEVRRFAERGDTVLIASRAGYGGAVSEWLADGAAAAVVVGGVAEVASVRVPDARRVAVVAAPGLAVQDSGAVVAALRARFPGLVPQHPGTLCHAADDYWASVSAVATVSDVLLVAGRDPAAQRDARYGALGLPVRFAATAEDVRAHWLKDAAAVGVTASVAGLLSAARELTAALAGLGPIAVVERRVHSSAWNLAGHPNDPGPVRAGVDASVVVRPRGGDPREAASGATGPGLTAEDL
ncbi:hypothetical protein [Streptacidiphilus sp. PAMC 29251]